MAVDGDDFAKGGDNGAHASLVVATTVTTALVDSSSAHRRCVNEKKNA
jgi:hypothetical protein